MRNALPPQQVAAEVSARCCRSLLKAAPSPRRKATLSKPRYAGARRSPKGAFLTRTCEKCGSDGKLFGALKQAIGTEIRVQQRPVCDVSHNLQRAPLFLGGEQKRWIALKWRTDGATISQVKNDAVFREPNIANICLIDVHSNRRNSPQNLDVNPRRRSPSGSHYGTNRRECSLGVCRAAACRRAAMCCEMIRYRRRAASGGPTWKNRIRRGLS